MKPNFKFQINDRVRIINSDKIIFSKFAGYTGRVQGVRLEKHRIIVTVKLDNPEAPEYLWINECDLTLINDIERAVKRVKTKV